jgi:4-amino-4-deoxy-L-arabinose transferase-like glycosyltransferase
MSEYSNRLKKFHPLASKGILPLCGLITLSIAIRLPFFFFDVIDWDEGVFILIGQWLADGNLPYDRLYDNKPPLGFAFFAASILLLGKDLVMVRLAGAIWIGLAAFLLYRIFRKFGTEAQSYASAAFSVVAVSACIASGQNVMMEHVALVPVLLSMLVLMAPHPRHLHFFVAGLLLSAATLIRLNLAYLALPVGILIICWRGKKIWKESAIDALWYMGGGALVLFLIYIPYALTGLSDAFITSVFKIPFAFSGDGGGFFTTLLYQLRNVLPWIRFLDADSASWPTAIHIKDYIFGLIFWVGGSIGIVKIAFTPNPAGSSWGHKKALFLVFFLSILCSIGFTGFPWGHYLIQVIPFFAIGAGYLLPKHLPHPIAKGASILLIIAACALGANSVYLYPHMQNEPPEYVSLSSEYGNLAKRYRSGDKLHLGSRFQVADFLNENKATDDTLFVVDGSLIYWLTDRLPLTPLSAFPIQITNKDVMIRFLYGENATSEQELEKVLLQKPTYIVVSDHSWIFGQKTLKMQLEETLQTTYDRSAVINGFFVFRRKSQS